jgi:hypothetical protein
LIGKYLATEQCSTATVVTIRDGLFDAMPEMDASGPPAADVVGEFQSAVAGAHAVVVDLRRAGEVNKRTISLCFQFARELKNLGVRRALCGSFALQQVWAICKGNLFSPCVVDLEEAIRMVLEASDLPEAGPASDPAR